MGLNPDTLFVKSKGSSPSGESYHACKETLRPGPRAWFVELRSRAQSFSTWPKVDCAVFSSVPNVPKPDHVSFGQGVSDGRVLFMCLTRDANN